MERDRVERQIARFRVWFFALILASGLPMVLATRHAERLGRLADQAEREAGRARATAAAAIEAAIAARERATRAAKDLREAEDRISADH